MFQLSEAYDQKLNELGHKIGENSHTIEQATQEKNKAWEEVLEAWAEFGKEDKAARFICSDGTYLAKQTRAGKVGLNEDLLHRLIFEASNSRQANILWNKITERKVDPKKLEQAVQRGEIRAETVDKCIQAGLPTFARIHEPWTKADAVRAEVYGIEKEERV